MARHLLLAGMAIGIAALCAAAACSSFGADGVDGVDGVDGAAAGDGGLEATAASVFCKGEAAKGAGLHFACADFDDGPTAWSVDRLMSGTATPSTNQARSPSRSLYVEIASKTLGGYARLSSTLPTAARLEFKRMELRFALLVNDLNTSVRLAQINVGSTYELFLVLANSNTSGATLSVGQRGALCADAGSTQEIAFLTKQWTRISLVVVRNGGAASSQAELTIDDQDAGVFPSSAHLEAITAEGALAMVGFVSIVGPVDTASVYIDDVVLRVE